MGAKIEITPELDFLMIFYFFSKSHPETKSDTAGGSQPRMPSTFNSDPVPKTRT